MGRLGANECVRRNHDVRQPEPSRAGHRRRSPRASACRRRGTRRSAVCRERSAPVDVGAPHARSTRSCAPYRRYGGRALSQTDADGYVDEMAVMCELWHAEPAARSVDELRAYFTDIRPELHATTAARRTARWLALAPVPLPARAPYAVIAPAAVGLLPGFVRRDLGIADASRVRAAGRAAGRVHARSARSTGSWPRYRSTLPPSHRDGLNQSLVGAAETQRHAQQPRHRAFGAEALLVEADAGAVRHQDPQPGGHERESQRRLQLDGLAVEAGVELGLARTRPRSPASTTPRAPTPSRPDPPPRASSGRRGRPAVWDRRS